MSHSDINLWEIRQGDCIALMRQMPDDSVDSIVTDPPYELGFMGKSWDASGIAFNTEVWREALRVLKPGGHLLAFSGSRTYHRMVVAIEDAGFEIRDQLQWVYGSGFPKSLDVSKAIDKAAGAEREVIGRKPIGWGGLHDNKNLNDDGWDKIGTAYPHGLPVTAPSTDAAKQWSGWGTALKPAHEPIVVARKPLIGTVAQNVLEHGTGALNIDMCRVGVDGRVDIGRWPANLIHDGSDEVLDAFPQAPGQLMDASDDASARKTQNVYGAMRRGSQEASRDSENEGTEGFKMKPGARRLDEGSAARFFYCAKASRSDRNDGCDILPDRDGGMNSNTSGQHITRRDGWKPEPVKNNHPTVKPTELMRYLCRLVTPPNGLILDPFTGSGSTGRGAVLEGFRFLGLELNEEYVEISRARIIAAQVAPSKKTSREKAPKTAPSVPPPSLQPLPLFIPIGPNAS